MVAGMPPTPEQFRSRAWRMRNLYAIRLKNGQLVHFVPNAAQEAYDALQHYRDYILKARQMGLSTFKCVEHADVAGSTKGTTIAIVDKTEDDGMKKVAMVKTAWENIDNPLVSLFPEHGRLLKEANPIVEESKTRLLWKSGSSVEVGTSIRGGTVQRLHISELGYVAARAPKRAAEVITGALNTVGPDCNICIESTHEGGRFGDNYRMIKTAMDAAGVDKQGGLQKLQFRFHFCAWHLEPSYVATPLHVIPERMLSYFAGLARRGIHLTPEQMAFYVLKEQEQGLAMKREFPSTPEEALDASIEGAIYGDLIAAARAEGRIQDFNALPDKPIFAFWDIGLSDYTAIWFIQFNGASIEWLDWIEESGKPSGFYVDAVRRMSEKHGKPIHKNYLPHDANTRDRGTGLSYVQSLIQAGMDPLTIAVVPRTPDIWIGINRLRALLPRSRFHDTNCNTPRKTDRGDELPSGIGCLEAYRKHTEVHGGMINEAPVHDLTSHSSDAARTFAEAHAQGMIPYTATSAGFKAGQTNDPWDDDSPLGVVVRKM